MEKSSMDGSCKACKTCKHILSCADVWLTAFQFDKVDNSFGDEFTAKVNRWDRCGGSFPEERSTSEWEKNDG